MPHSPAPLGVGVQARVPGLDVIGGMRNSVAVASANRSLLLDDGNPLVSVTTGNTDRTIDLPACNLTTVSVEYLIQKADTGTGDVILVGRNSTVTISNASPGVVTWTAHGLVDGMAIVLETTGGLPTGLTAGTTYYVVSAATDTFSLSATPGGSAINTSSAGSGTHTAYETINGKPRWTLTTQYEWIRVIAKAEGWVVSGAGWFTDALRAHSSAGLTLYDDGGNVGIFIKDGAAGRIGLGTTDVEDWDADFDAVLQSEYDAIIFGSTTAGVSRFHFMTNSYYSTTWKTRSTLDSGRATLVYHLNEGRFIWYTGQGSGAGAAADETITWVAAMELQGDEYASDTVILNLGGAIGGTDRDVTIGLASDVTDFWDESASERLLTLPSGGNLKVSVGGSTMFMVDGTSIWADVSTTANAANMEMAGAAGAYLRRSTSSLRYKQDVRELADDSLVDLLRPIVFRSRCASDDQSIDHFGFGAEDVHALGIPGLVHYVEETRPVEEADAKGRVRTVQRPTGRGLIPDGVQYQSIIPLLVARVQKLTARVAALEGAKT